MGRTRPQLAVKRIVILPPHPQSRWRAAGCSSNVPPQRHHLAPRIGALSSAMRRPSVEDLRAQRQLVLYWENLAGVLHRASEVLWHAYETSIATYKAQAAARNESFIVDMEDPDPRLFSVSYLLLGAATENLLKATLLVSEWPGDVERHGHNLPALAEVARLPIDARQRQLLVRLQEAVMWRSKYPAPKLGQPGPAQGELSPEDRPDLLEIHRLCRAAFDAAYTRSRDESDGKE